jgi:HSP20 family protein
MSSSETLHKDSHDSLTTPPTSSRVAKVPALVDIFENDSEFLLLSDMPGADPETIDVRLEAGTLRIEAKQKPIELDEEQSVSLLFTRSFSVPDVVDPEGIQASFEQGVLKIKLTKGEHAKLKKIAVKANLS